MQTRTHTQTATHARHIASKVAADLKRIQRIYQVGDPTDSDIAAYQEEIALLLNQGYLDTVTYGFKRNGKWIFALKYEAIGGNLHGGGDDPGGIGSRADVSDASFSSFLSYSSSWLLLSAEERRAFEASLPFQRTEGYEPGIEKGRWVESRKYQSGTLGVQRSLIERA